MDKPLTKTHFKTSEGRYLLWSERTTGLIPFQNGRATRLTVATLRGGAEQGQYMVFNVGEQLHICPYDGTDKDPVRSIVFNPISIRDGHPRVHAFMESRDGSDLLVGIANGEVYLLSLRVQLQQPAGSNKPVVAATLNEGGVHDATRCSAVAWVPRSGGAQFLAAHASGSILVYKKSGSMMGEATGKLLSMSSLTSSRTSGLNPCQTISVPGCGGVNDVAFNPDGNRLAAACRDGSVRLLDWPSGQCVAGYRSYYGAALCCCWSPDGRFVASGGEDDLVAMYSVQDRQVVAFGEGHSSFVSRVAFDPWACTDTNVGGSQQGGATGAAAGAAAAGGAGAATERIYRLGSAGHDTVLCLWDLVLEEDPTFFNQQTGQTGIKRVASTTHVPIPKASSGLNLANLAQPEAAAAAGPSSSSSQHHPHSHQQQHPPLPPPSPQQQQQQHHGGQPHSQQPRPGTPPDGGGGGGGGSIVRHGSSNLLALLGKGHPAGGVGGNGLLAPANPICASVPRAEMTIIPPIMQHKLHAEPLSDVLFTDEAIFTACQGGQVKCWARPSTQAQLDSQDML